MKPQLPFYILIMLFLTFGSYRQHAEKPINGVAFVGATVLDFDNYGQSTNDIENAVVLIRDNKIVAVGDERSVDIPKGVKVVDVSGTYIIPGLIDGFATLNDQTYANAFLYMGVTTIVGLDGGRRGNVFWEADPAPEIYKFDSYYGEAEWSEEEQRILRWANEDEIVHAIDSIAAKGVKVLLVHYGVKPDQLQTIVEKCREHQIATIGELGHSKVKEALDAGVQSFVHISRYSIDIVPEVVKKGYEDAPFGRPRIDAYEYFENFDTDNDSILARHAKLVGDSKAGLIPTHALFYPSFSFAKNPWKHPVTTFIEADSIHLPLNKETGKWTILRNTEKWDTLFWSEKLVNNLLNIEKNYVQNGAKYLTGSGTDAFGTMPGISLHSELEMLQRSGLTPREAIAAATTNFSSIYGWEHIGQIKEGSEADMLLLSKNPLESLDHLDSIDFVVLNGNIINRKDLLPLKD